MYDLEPAARAMAGLVAGVRDDQLSAPTPCSETTLGDLLDHVDSFARAFTGAARKSASEAGPPPKANAANLGDDWRSRIPQRLDELAESWRDPEAWQGMTRAGGLDMPAEVAAAVATDELVLHGWDVAVASGQPFQPPPEMVEVAHGFVQGAVARHPNGTPGLFGLPVPVADDAPLLARLLGLSGRDPAWRPDASR